MSSLEVDEVHLRQKTGDVLGKGEFIQTVWVAITELGHSYMIAFLYKHRVRGTLKDLPVTQWPERWTSRT